MECRIITDDFTSATDGVVAFAQAGWPSTVLLGDTAEAPSEVLSVDTDSRHCKPAVAAARVARWAAAWRGAHVLVKQFDSTLRGPLATECRAAWQASGRARMLVVPAFPAAGRTCVAGVVHVDGVPVDRTVFAHDPRHPVLCSDLARLLADGGLPAVKVADATAAAAAFGAGATAVLVDARTDVELQAIADAFVHDRSLLWAGSTGILRALAGALPGQTVPDVGMPVSSHPWAVLGSRHPVTRQQARRLGAEACEVTLLQAPQGDADPAHALDVVLQTLSVAIAQGRCDGFVASGGETARAVAVSLRATGVTVVREIEPGVPLCLLQLPDREVPFITKAGGFGDDLTLVRCVRALAGEGA